jgi:phenylalanyl-tRNA synthetase alpha chain
MSKTQDTLKHVAENLRKRITTGDSVTQVLRSDELRALYAEIPTLPADERAAFGKQVNQLKTELEELGAEQTEKEDRRPIDVTAPFDVNTTEQKRPHLLPSNYGSQHPIPAEISDMIDIFYRMGFNVSESRQIDDDYHMFESLNFPDDHPARDHYDTFMSEEGFIAPAHTSTMQNRVLQEYKHVLADGEDIRVVIPDRVFRNEDLDATHEHTFYQLEGVVVGKNIHTGNLVATLQTYMSQYFKQELNTKIQPFYFPFTEPSFEFAVQRPDFLRKDDSEEQKWLELGGCGMIHPNVLSHANIDPNIYTGFAWGFGIERLVMMKYGIEDIRHFESAKLDFLRQF